jgi:methylmalonyl-CoA/ethylmalonyl-CoA epimerase
MQIELRPHHLGLSVPDLEASIAWYEHVLEFKLENQLRVDAIPARIAFLKRDGFRIELFEVTNASSLPEDRRIPNLDLKTHGTKHLAFCVPDVDATVLELQSRGADIAMHIRVHGKPTAFIRDNSGNLLEFVQTSDFA